MSYLERLFPKLDSVKLKGVRRYWWEFGNWGTWILVPYDYIP